MKKTKLIKLALALASVTMISGCSSNVNSNNENATYDKVIITEGNTETGVENDYTHITFTDVNEDNLGASYTDEFEEQMITQKIPADEIGSNILKFAGYLAMLGFSASANQPAVFISNIMGLLDLVGITSPAQVDKDQIIIDKLEEMDSKLDDINDKLDRLSDKLDEVTAEIELGIDKVLYNQYQNNWETFYQTYVEKIDDQMRAYKWNVNNAIIDWITDTSSTRTIQMAYYLNKDKKLSLTAINPKSPHYDLIGNPIAEVKQEEIIDFQTNFAKVIENYGRHGSYYEGITNDLNECLTNWVSKTNPGLDADQLKEATSDRYDAIMSMIHENLIDKDVAQNVVNLYINLCRNFMGVGVTSKFSQYVNMIECLYNFQNEAKQTLIDFRANMKLMLVEYGAFVTSIATYCPGIDVSEITNITTQMDEYIFSHTGLHGIDKDKYCYTTKSYLDPSVIKANFNSKYNNHGNDCSYYYNFEFTDCLRCYKFKINNNSYTLQWGDYVGRFDLMSNSDYQKIMARKSNLIDMGIENARGSLATYLNATGIYTASELALNPMNNEMLLSYNGISDTKTENFSMKCVDDGSGSYYSKGQVLNYKDRGHGTEHWKAIQANAKMADIGNGNVYDTSIGRAARYDETYWLWFHDEHHAFEEYPDGYLMYAIFKM